MKRQKPERPRIVSAVRMPMRLDENHRAIRGSGRIYEPGDENALRDDVGRDALVRLEAAGAIIGFCASAEVEARRAERAREREAAAQARRYSAPPADNERDDNERDDNDADDDG